MSNIVPVSVLTQYSFKEAKIRMEFCQNILNERRPMTSISQITNEQNENLQEGEFGKKLATSRKVESFSHGKF